MRSMNTDEFNYGNKRIKNKGKTKRHMVRRYKTYPCVLLKEDKESRQLLPINYCLKGYKKIICFCGEFLIKNMV